MCEDAGRYSVSPVVDVHAHTLVRDVQLLVSRQPGFLDHQARERCAVGAATTDLDGDRLAGLWLRPLVDLDTRLSTMNAAGVDVQAVSVTPTQYHYWADRVLACDIVDTINNEIGGLIQRAPDRLIGIGTVALQYPDLAAEQLRRAVDDFDFRGVQISSTSAGRDLSHPDLDPFWSIAESLGIVVFIHPWGGGFGDRLATAYLGDVVGQPAETTVALSHLVFGGVLDRFPGLVVCAAHGGGYFPHSLGRADHAYQVRPACRTMLHRPSHYLSRMYVDSLVHTDDTLARLVAAVGPERVLLGSDYPYDMGAGDPLTGLGSLSSDARAAVGGGNARVLLRVSGSARGLAT